MLRCRRRKQRQWQDRCQLTYQTESAGSSISRSPNFFSSPIRLISTEDKSTSVISLARSLVSFLPPLYVNGSRSPPPSAQPNSLLTSRSAMLCPAQLSRSNNEPSSFRSPPRRLAGGRGRRRAVAGVAPVRVTGAGLRGRPERGGGLRVLRKTGEKEGRTGRMDGWTCKRGKVRRIRFRLRFNATLPPKMDGSHSSLPTISRRLPTLGGACLSFINSSSYSNREITPTVIQGL